MLSTSFYIVDAGSSKTDIYYYNNGDVVTTELSGYNPNRNDSNFINEFLKLNISISKKIYFYGSGLGNDIAINKLKEILNRKTNLFVYSDLLGAARSLLGTSPGIISILGTGGVFAYYDGSEIVEKKGGYGYLIDDLGGGLELAKFIISKWLNNEFKTTTNKEISAHLNLNQSEFIKQFYKNKNLHNITSICKLTPKLALNDAVLSKSILEYFQITFNRHLFSLCKTHNFNSIHFTGSIAENFSKWIQEILIKNNIEISKIAAKPINGLLEYHLSQKNTSV